MSPKPLVFGYLRILDHVQDADIRRMEHKLRSFAATEGFCLATTFYEHVSGSQAAFIELTLELCRAAAHNVVVPSLEHLSTHPLVRELMLNQLQQRVGAQIWTVD